MQLTTALSTMLEDLARGLRERLPELAARAQAPEFHESGREAWIRIPVPNHEGHELGLYVREDEVELHYTDGEAHGPAERLFVIAPDGDAAGLRDAVITFLVDLVDERIVVVRQRTQIWILLIFPSMVRASVKFLETWALPRDSYDAVWSWRGTHDQ